MMTADSDVPAELSKLQKGYELLGELSRDDMVTVYVARDKLSGNEVAIKVLRAVDARGRQALAHYASDARLLTALEHPNIVAVHSVKWLSEDVVAVVTERVRGPTLRQVLDVAGTLPVARATEVLRGLGRGLAWAHSSQIMHRDVRPENVIFEDGTGRVVLSDFGLARRVEGTAAATPPGADAYRAPELSDGRYPDRRSDVYSLGVVGWELLTGRRPWPDMMEAIEPGQRAPAPPPLAEVRPGLPPALVAAIEGAVQLDRDRRIPDVVTFMERLTKVAPPRPKPEEEPVDEVPVSFEPTEWVALPVPRMPRKPAPAGGEREVPREAAREATLGAAPTAEPEAERRVELMADRHVEPAADRQAERRVDREVEREIERDVRPAPAESLAPPPPREPRPAAGEHAQAMTSSSAFVASPVPPAIPADSKRRPRKGGASRDVAPTFAVGTTPEGASAQPAQTRPPQTTPTAPELPADRAEAPVVAGSELPPQKTKAESDRSELAREERHRLEEVRSEPARAEQERPDRGRADALPAAAAGLASAAAAAPTEPDAARATSVASQPPTREARTVGPSSAIPSDVELPPPEPVRFADLPSEPLRGPISGPARGPTHGPTRFDRMRGGLGTPREPKSGSRGREPSAEPPAPAPLQPLWDMPAEFPLPVMPDPRPVLADTGTEGNDVARRRWTRRGIGIAGAALLLVGAAVTLARMERAPNTTAGLMEPETPTGYGGDIVLTPPAGDTTVPEGQSAARAGVARSSGASTSGGARASRGAASAPARQPTV
ncbi:MAG: protein kinase, partial [Gemmatimonadota bacterium]|nr:protein kinase [Gemmatimonadota bacterium]